MVSPPNEVTCGQFLKRHGVDLVERPVEGFQGGCWITEACQPQATFDTPFSTCAGRYREKLLQELQVRQLRFVGGRQDLIQLDARQRNLQNLQVALNLIA